MLPECIENINLTFAPVIIPTLCRYLHLKQCLESLANCMWANMTDIYISVDYPAKDEHWDGYNKICILLEDKSWLIKFRSFNVIKRDHNLGLGESGNCATLIEEVLKNHEALILSEDDNVFSPNFLDYCNKGLYKFKDDKSILAICGYRHFYDIKYDDNTFFLQNVDFSAWGYAIWKDRIEKLNKVDRLWFKKRLNFRSFCRLRKYNGNSKAVDFFSYALRNNKPVVLIDKALSVYMAIENMNIVMPTISLVRNIGIDGTGANFHNANDDMQLKFATQIVDKNLFFNFVGNGNYHYDYNRHMYKNQSIDKISHVRFLYLICRILLRDLYVRIQCYKKYSFHN